MPGRSRARNGQFPGHGHQEHKDNGNHGPWACSEKQKELILKIVSENNLDKQEVDDLAKERFGKGVKELNRLDPL